MDFLCGSIYHRSCWPTNYKDNDIHSDNSYLSNFIIRQLLYFNDLDQATGQ